MINRMEEFINTIKPADIIADEEGVRYSLKLTGNKEDLQRYSELAKKYCIFDADYYLAAKSIDLFLCNEFEEWYSKIDAACYILAINSIISEIVNIKLPKKKRKKFKNDSAFLLTTIFGISILNNQQVQDLKKAITIVVSRQQSKTNAVKAAIGNTAPMIYELSNTLEFNRQKSAYEIYDKNSFVAKEEEDLIKQIKKINSLFDIILPLCEETAQQYIMRKELTP